MWYISKLIKVIVHDSERIVLLSSIWIAGLTRSGKTTRLVSEFQQWVRERLRVGDRSIKSDSLRGASADRLLTPTILVLAANDDNRRNLNDRLSISVKGSYPVLCKTPLGFISDEVTLFWPLLFEQLKLKAQFPLRLRPETEQELATRLWRSKLVRNSLTQTGMSESRLVRQILDLLQLAGASGICAEEIPIMLAQGIPNFDDLSIRNDDVYQLMGDCLLEWRQWCLERGLLSYGIIYELYWRYLLNEPTYQQHLSRRYQAIFADDTDDYPAIAKDLFEILLDRGCRGVFTHNSDGAIRLGLNADPTYLASLANRCQVEELSVGGGLAESLEAPVLQLLCEPIYINNLPPSVRSIQTNSRAQLLRQTAQTIIEAVKAKEVKPEEIAIIAPGLDEIARYTLIEILSAAGISIEPLNEQRPLISSPLIRALLTLLALVYPGLGRLVVRDMVAEMLVVLSQKPREIVADLREQKEQRRLVPDIDIVRAGLIADYCYAIDLEQPRLLPPETFARWDRLGYRATQAYQEIVTWI
ncbi:MAG: recombinase family protein, partial [Hydrococcus sp. Prado102]|nr:recombinase family protein [Hydrococcus sp. Prado102]